MKTILSLLLGIIAASCSAQEDVSIKLTIHNESGKVLDSIAVYDLFKGNTTFYNIQPDSVIVKEFVNKASMLPKGESVVFYLYAFDKNYFYSMSNGLIGFPTSYLKDEYHFYIYDTYIANKEGYVPPEGHRDHRKTLEEYEKMYGRK